MFGVSLVIFISLYAPKISSQDGCQFDEEESMLESVNGSAEIQSIHEEEEHQEQEFGKELWHPARKKIMIIDDDVNFRLAMAEILVEQGYEVSTAKDGETALNQLVHDNDPPDLILVDVVMPIKGGLEFRREQAKLEGISEIPVVFVTGQGIVDGELCLQKPFDEKEFLDYIKQYV